MKQDLKHKHTTADWSCMRRQAVMKQQRTPYTIRNLKLKMKKKKLESKLCLLLNIALVLLFPLLLPLLHWNIESVSFSETQYTRRTQKVYYYYYFVVILVVVVVVVLRHKCALFVGSSVFLQFCRPISFPLKNI